MGHIHELYDFTVSFYILHPSEPKICLHYHQKLSFWNQLGGHIELDEDPLNAIKREMKEEAGLNEDEYDLLGQGEHPSSSEVVALPKPFGIYKYDYGKHATHKHIDMAYAVKSKTERLAPAEDESQKIQWFTIREICDLEDQGELGDGVVELCEWVLNNYPNS